VKRTVMQQVDVVSKVYGQGQCFVFHVHTRIKILKAAQGSTKSFGLVPKCLCFKDAVC
jgi:hypothetical protein